MKTNQLFERLWEHGRTLRRVGLVLVTCLITITQAWGYTIEKSHIYYDNSFTNWSDTYIQVFIEKDGDNGYCKSSGIGMSHIAHTDLFYVYIADWNSNNQDALRFAQTASNDWGFEERSSWARVSGAYCSARYEHQNLANWAHIFKNSSNTAGANIARTKNGANATAFNHTVTVGVKTKVGNNAFSSSVASVATISMQNYTFNSTEYGVVQDNYTTSVPTLAKGSTSTYSIYPAFTSNVTYSFSNLTEGYYFVGWYDGSGNLLSSDPTYTKYTTENYTIYAYFAEAHVCIEGRFHVTNSSRNGTWTNTFGSGDWDENSTRIKFDDYDGTKKAYYLHTYATPHELSTKISNYDPVFYIKISSSGSSVTDAVPFWSSSSTTLSAANTKRALTRAGSVDNDNLKFSSSDDSGYAILYFDESDIWYDLEHTVTYNANGATGTAPSDASYYMKSDDATVLGKNTLAKTNCGFAGWRTSASSGTWYVPGETFSMGTANVNLYAQWVAEANMVLGTMYTADEMKASATGGSYRAGISPNGIFEVLGSGTTNVTGGPMEYGSDSRTIDGTAFTKALYFKGTGTGTPSGSTLPTSRAIKFRVGTSGKLHLWVRKGGKINIVKSGGSASAVGTGTKDSDYEHVSLDVTSGTYYLYATEGTTSLYGMKLATCESITSQPTSIAKANVGEAQELSVTAAGTNLTYQWQTCNSDGSSATNVSGAAYSGGTTATLTFTPSSVGVTYYKCVVTGDCEPVTSDVVSITAKNAISPTLTYSSSVTYGNTLSASKTGTWGDGDIEYTSSDDSKVSVAADGTVTGEAVGSATITATIADGDDYWGGSATSSTITVNKADLAGTASTGTASSVTHNSASLPFTISTSTDGIASITIKVYSGESVAKTYPGITPASSGSYSATGLSASTTYTYTVTLIGDANHNDKAETSKSTSFTTTAAPTCSGDPSALTSNELYTIDEMVSNCSETAISSTTSDGTGIYQYGLSNNGKFYVVGTTNGDNESTGTVEMKKQGTGTITVRGETFTYISWFKDAGSTSCRSIKFVTPSAGKLIIYGKVKSGKGNIELKQGSSSAVDVMANSKNGSDSVHVNITAGATCYLWADGTSAALYGIYFDKVPEFSSSDPADGDTDVPVSGTIVLTFDESISSVTAAKFSLSTGSISAVAVDGTDDTKVNITYSGLPGSTEVTLSVAAGAVTDAAGNTSAALSGITFTTVATGYAITTGDHDGGTIAITDDEDNVITSAEEDDEVYLTATPNTGYEFRGWTVLDESKERVSVTQSWKPSAHFTMPGEAVTVSAEFTQVNYSIMPKSVMHFRYTVQVGEAEAVDGYTRAHYGDVITLAQSSIADGYHLKTWGVTKTESGDEVTMASENTFVMPAEDVTINPIVGKWYTVSFDANTGNDEDNPDPITQTAVDGAITMPAAPTKDGYTFVNWMIGGTTVAASGSYTPPTDVTAYATWKETCAGGGGSTTLFAWAGGTGANVTVDETSLNGNNMGTMTTGTSIVARVFTAANKDAKIEHITGGYKLGYNAVNIEIQGTANFAAGDVITITGRSNSSDEARKFAIGPSTREDPNGATDTVCTNARVNNSESLTYTATLTSDQAGAKIRIFRFAGKTVLLEAITVTRPGSGSSCYYVTYDGNGAAGGYTNDETAYSSGATVTVATNENNHFTHPGYSFTGWNTRADGEGTGYAAGATFSISENTTLYAQWTPVTLYFTGTRDGDWTDPLNWSPNCVPTIEHDVVIQQRSVKLFGPYAEDRKGHGVAKSVRINNGYSLDIWTEGGLIVAEDIKAQHAVDGEYEATTPDDLSIETTILGNGTLITGEENSTTQALYKFRTKAFTCYVDQDGKIRKYYYNQYCGIPFQPIDPMTSYYSCTIYEYGAATDSWITPTTEYLQPFVAYNLLRKNAEAGDDIWLRGTLNLPGKTGTVTLNCGWRGDDTGTTINEVKSYQDYMFANSWTAPIDISSLDEEDCSANLVQSIYMFNTGYEREKGVKEIGNKDGQWSVFPFKAGKYMKDAVIPGTQAFLVTAMSSGASLTLNYGKHVYTPALEAGGANNFPTRAPKRVKEAEIAPSKLMITVLSDNIILDNMYIFEREDFTEEFDNGWDGTKIIGSTRAPQLYARQGNSKMEVAAVPEMEGLEIGFIAGTDTNSYAFEFEYLESEPLYLYDRETMEYTPIENKGTYSFSTEDNEDHARFVLTRSKSPQIATGFINTLDSSNKDDDTSVHKVLINDHIYIIRGGKTYSVDGALVK